jgi:hypothetical protein
VFCAVYVCQGSCSVRNKRVTLLKEKHHEKRDNLQIPPDNI